MIILGIESSCDETAAAVVENGTTLLSSVLATSQETHVKYRGIVPDQAAREQLKSIIPVIHEAIQSMVYGLPSTAVVSSQKSVDKIDAIAVTVGPGLIGSLLVGVETAKTLALAWNKPLIPVNHLVGHIYANWITANKSSLVLELPASPAGGPTSLPELPALVLLVSGGHSDLVLMTDHGKFTHLGSTRDDAAGECFDKCGRLLGLPYPYGPHIQDLALKFDGKNKISLPRPLEHSKDYDFSFSGLKTAFKNEYDRLFPNPQPLITNHSSVAALAHELQEAVTDVLVEKTLRAVKEYSVSTLLLAGGVSANLVLREKFKFQISNFKFPVELRVPPIKLCTDNAAYIASAGFFLNQPKNISEVEADPSLTIFSIL